MAVCTLAFAGETCVHPPPSSGRLYHNDSRRFTKYLWRKNPYLHLLVALFRFRTPGFFFRAFSRLCSEIFDELCHHQLSFPRSLLRRYLFCYKWKAGSLTSPGDSWVLSVLSWWGCAWCARDSYCITWQIYYAWWFSSNSLALFFFDLECSTSGSVFFSRVKDNCLRFCNVWLSHTVF